MGRLRRASVQLPQLQAIARLLAVSESQATRQTGGGGGGSGAGPRELVGLTSARLNDHKCPAADRGPRSARFRGDRREKRRTGRTQRPSERSGCWAASRAKESPPCAVMPASGHIRAAWAITAIHRRVMAAPIYRMHGLTLLFRCSFLLAGPSAPRPHGPAPTYLLCTQVLRRTCSSYENARFYPTCARYLSHLCTVFIPPVHGLSGQSTAAGSTVRRSVPRWAGFPRPWPILRGCSWCEPTTPSGVHSRWSDAPCERGRS